MTTPQASYTHEGITYKARFYSDGSVTVVDDLTCNIVARAKWKNTTIFFVGHTSVPSEVWLQFQLQLVQWRGERVVSQETMSVLTALRREIAGDGPTCRVAGALEAFDEACEKLRLPFIEP